MHGKENKISIKFGSDMDVAGDCINKNQEQKKTKEKEKEKEKENIKNDNPKESVGHGNNICQLQDVVNVDKEKITQVPVKLNKGNKNKNKQNSRNCTHSRSNDSILFKSRQPSNNNTQKNDNENGIGSIDHGIEHQYWQVWIDIYVYSLYFT